MTACVGVLFGVEGGEYSMDAWLSSTCSSEGGREGERERGREGERVIGGTLVTY